jgi:hypothetical protein
MGLVAAGVAGWATYRAADSRLMQARMGVDNGTRAGPCSVADVDRFTPSATAVRCQPWDIGTGVTGLRLARGQPQGRVAPRAR